MYQSTSQFTWEFFVRNTLNPNVNDNFGMEQNSKTFQGGGILYSLCQKKPPKNKHLLIILYEHSLQKGKDTVAS